MKRNTTKAAARASMAWVAAGLAGIALAVAIAAPGCSTSTSATESSCSLNSDCASGLICALGKCRTECVDAADCPVAGSSCIDDGRNPVCETPTEKNTPCEKESDCPVPLACASDYRCRNLCFGDADCNVLGITGRVCATDKNGVDYCADPNEVTSGAITVAPPPGANTSTPVIEPEGGAVAATALPQGTLVVTTIGRSGGVIGAGGVTVSIPAGALTSDVAVTIQISGQSGPLGTVSPVFEIGPTGTIFAKPITIAFDYTASELVGLPPSDFAVETAAADSNASWTPLSQIVVDVDAQTIAGQTLHLSLYALVEQPASFADATTTVNSGGDGSACTDACTSGQTQCASGGVQTCQAQADGCTQWITTATCGDHQTCTVTGADGGLTAICTCNATPCASTGTVCQDAQTLATCAKDADGCFYASTSTCPMPMSCSGLAPNAVCSVRCTSSCTPGATSCVNGQLATCTLGVNGCYSYGSPAACGTHQSCTGTAGTAACSCNADPVCSAVGNTCAGPTTLATCARDPQGCVVESTSTACTNGTCSQGACGTCAAGTMFCANACVPCPSQPANGTLVCAGASCVASCNNANFPQLCGAGSAAACVNTQTDNANCGKCGSPCSTATAPDKCDQTYVCQTGSCVGSSPVLCPPATDACHVAGSCNTGTGVCSAQTPVTDGTQCNDGNACTQADACQKGMCTGTPVTCVADQCHVAGPCAPATGCPNSLVVNGTACKGAAAGMTCQNGSCECPQGTMLCTSAAGASTCADLMTDANNCGVCNMVCPREVTGAPPFCSAGACAL